MRELGSFQVASVTSRKKIPFLEALVFTKPNKSITFGCLRQFSSLLLLFLFLLLSFHQRVERHQHLLFPAKFSSEELNQSDQQVLLQGGCKQTQTLVSCPSCRAATRIPKVFGVASKTAIHVRTKHLFTEDMILINYTSTSWAILMYLKKELFLKKISLDLFESFNQSWNTKTSSGLKPEYEVSSIFLSHQKTSDLTMTNSVTLCSAGTNNYSKEQYPSPFNS